MGRAKWLVLVMAVAALTSCAHRPPRYVDVSVMAKDEAQSFVVLYPLANGDCQVTYPEVTEIKSADQKKVSWQVVNLCTGDPEVEIGTFKAASEPAGCTGTSGDPFQEKSKRAKPGRPRIAPATFNLSGKGGCWKYSITVRDENSTKEIDPMVRIDR
jgi:hypothetical protein